MASTRLIVGITGASGAAHGVRMLEALRAAGGFETHLVVSSAGWMNIDQELGRSRKDVERLADVVHGVKDVGASIASGSFPVHGMVVAPCSMRTLAAISIGLDDNLIVRAASVTLKERRRLVVMPREAPLTLAHLRNMTALAEMGAVVFPPVPAFYLKPATIAEMVDHTCGRVLELLGVDQSLAPDWGGLRTAAAAGT